MHIRKRQRKKWLEKIDINEKLHGTIKLSTSVAYAFFNNENPVRIWDGKNVYILKTPVNMVGLSMLLSVIPLLFFFSREWTWVVRIQIRFLNKARIQIRFLGGSISNPVTEHRVNEMPHERYLKQNVCTVKYIEQWILISINTLVYIRKSHYQQCQNWTRLNIHCILHPNIVFLETQEVVFVWLSLYFVSF